MEGAAKSCHGQIWGNQPGISSGASSGQGLGRRGGLGWVGTDAGNRAEGSDGSQVPPWGARENTAGAAEGRRQLPATPIGAVTHGPGLGGRLKMAGAAGTLCRQLGRRFASKKWPTHRRCVERVRKHASILNRAYGIIC